MFSWEIFPPHVIFHFFHSFLGLHFCSFFEKLTSGERKLRALVDIMGRATRERVFENPIIGKKKNDGSPTYMKHYVVCFCVVFHSAGHRISSSQCLIQTHRSGVFLACNHAAIKGGVRLPCWDDVAIVVSCIPYVSDSSSSCFKSHISRYF